jgi:hypothetical protein
MKIEITEPSDKEEVKFPCLMISKNGRIVLFHAYEKGIALNDWASSNIGDYSESWFMPTFKPFKGKVTLSND